MEPTIIEQTTQIMNEAHPWVVQLYHSFYAATAQTSHATYAAALAAEVKALQELSERASWAALLDVAF